MVSEIAKSIQGVPVSQIIPLVGMKKMTAEHMLRSHQTAAEVTVSREIDVTEVIQLRSNLDDKYTREENLHITLTHLLLKASAQILKEYCIFNSTLEGDEIKILAEFNIGIAVALEDGNLVVPIVRRVDQKGLIDIAKESTNVIIKARSGRLNLDDVLGGTFTLSNFGIYGGELGTPIIKQPESAILGIGRIVEKPAVYENKISIRSLMQATLTFDHRVANGAIASQFLHAFSEILEDPTKIQLGI